MASDDVAVLSQPTVADLVAALQKLDQSKPVRIEDADTNWCIDVIHIEDRGGPIVLSGEYDEMARDWPKP